MKKIVICVLVMVVGLMTACSGKSGYEASIELANKYMLDGNYTEAILEFKKAIEIEPNKYEPYEGLVNAYISLNNDESVQGIVDAVKAYYAVNPSDERLIDYVTANIGRLPVDTAKAVLNMLLEFLDSDKITKTLAKIKNGESVDSAEKTTVEETSEETETTTEASNSIISSVKEILAEKYTEDGWTYKMSDIDNDDDQDIILYNAGLNGEDTSKYCLYVMEFNGETFKSLGVTRTFIPENITPAQYYKNPSGSGFVEFTGSGYEEIKSNDEGYWKIGASRLDASGYSGFNQYFYMENEDSELVEISQSEFEAYAAAVESQVCFTDGDGLPISDLSAVEEIYGKK